MDQKIKEALYESLQTASPSGSEEQVTSLFTKVISPFVDEVYTDVNGNCIAHKKGSGTKIMFMAHADEIGLMISYIDDHGFLYFKEIGGIDTNILPGQRVSIMGQQGPVSGVIGNRGQVNYSASKAGLIGATKALATELASRGITVNSVAPGVIETEMIKDAPLDMILPAIPMKRVGKPEEVAATVVFLLSEGAAYITRQVISVNGGLA